MRTLYATARMSYLSLDSWSESYIGARWVIYNNLPNKEFEAMAHHHSMAKMILVSSSHMLEFMLFNCIRRKIESLDLCEEELKKILKKLKSMNYGSMLFEFSKVLPEIESFDPELEPLLSINEIRRRRNLTVHKDTSYATLEMASSALFTAVSGSKFFQAHFFPNEEFKYTSVLKKYPLENFSLYSQVCE